MMKRNHIVALFFVLMCGAVLLSAQSVVYLTRDISSAGLNKAYKALNWAPTGNVAVKLSTGEPPASHPLDPSLIKKLVKKVNGTIIECNTAYNGSRSSTAAHLQVAKDHGYTAIATVDIMDADGSVQIPVYGGQQLSTNYVGKNFLNYQSCLVLSHFKGHQMAGFGGAIKNISIGIGSREGKAWIHSGGKSRTNPWGGRQVPFLEAMADAAKSVSDHLGRGKNIAYINVMNHLSIDCDCNGNPAEPDMHDIGILSSMDPVALDQACVDLIYNSDDNNATFIRRINSCQGLHTLESAEKIGLGNRKYKLVILD